MISRTHSWLTALGLAAAVSLTGCGKKDDAAKPGVNAPADAAANGTKAAPDSMMEVDLARTLKAQPDFYVFKSKEDFAAETKDLTWEDGSENPEFADVNAMKGGTANIWLQDYPRTLRTIGQDATSGIRPYLLDDVQPRAVHPHPNIPGAYFPGFTSGWASSRATKTVYFKIDPSARWSDGQPLTTDDIVFLFYFMRSPDLNEPWYNDFYSKTYSRLTVYDPLSFAVTLADWKPDAVDRAGDWTPYPRHAYGEFGPGWGKKFQWRIMPTLAPYTLRTEDIDDGQSITFRRDKNWWAKDKRFFRGRFNPDKLRLIVIRDPNKAFEAFKRGDLDFFGLGAPSLWYDKLPDNDELVQGGYIAKYKFFNRTPQPDIGLWINSSKPVLKNRDVREGIQFATNFALVCKQYYRGDAVVMQTRSDGYGWRMNPTIHARPFDPDKARECFAKAGFTKQGPDGILVNDDGRRLSFRVLTYQRPGVAEILGIIQQEALKAGVDFQIDIQDGTTAFKTCQEKNHEIGFIALNRSVELYPRYWEMYHGSNAWKDAYLDKTGKPVPKFSEGTPNPSPHIVCTDTNNMTMTFIPHLDDLIEHYDRAETLDEIKALASQIEQVIYDDASWVNGYSQPFLRVGSWRWVKWPKDFNTMEARDVVEMYLFSVDDHEKDEVLAARRSGRTYPPEIKVFDQYKEQ